jgi:mitochondrial translocator assembly and maintenance protein 41
MLASHRRIVLNRPLVRLLSLSSETSTSVAPPSPAPPNSTSSTTPQQRQKPSFASPTPRSGSAPQSDRAGTNARPAARSSFALPHLPPTFGRNQILSVPDSTRALLEEIVGRFRAPIRYAFAYGSGVFAQRGYSSGDVRPLPHI